MARTAAAIQHQQDGQEKPTKLKNSMFKLSHPEVNTMKLGFICDSDYKRALGSEEMPSEMAFVADAHANKVTEWAGFVKELFGSLYDPAGATKVHSSEVKQMGAELLAATEENAQWGELKAAARCHPVVAAAAARDLAVATAIATGIDQIPDDPGANKTPESLQQERERIEDMEIAPDDTAGQQAKNDALQQIDGDILRAHARRKAISEKLAKNANLIGTAVNQAANKAKQMAQAVNGLAACGYGTGPGAANKQEITPELVQQAMKMPDFSKIVDLVGRMKQTTDEKAAEAEASKRLTPAGIHKTKEIADVMPSELALYPVNPTLFVKRFFDNELMGMERESPDRKNKGDLMIFVDRSGSMSGSRIEWARAMAIAGIMQAQKQNRRWTVTMYADYGSELRTSSSDKGFQHAMNTLSIDAGGGTSTDWAINRVLSNPNLSGGLRDPDILLITDGDWEDLSAGTKKLLDGKKTRLFVVQLEGQVRKIEAATKVWRINELTIDAASNVLLEIRF